MTIIDTLKAQLVEVAQRRETHERLAGNIKEAREGLEKLLAEDKAAAAVAKAALDQSDTAARVLALAIYETTKDTKPADGVQVKVGKAFTYKEEDALAWAKKSGIALRPESLDVEAFEKIMKASPASFPFVAVADAPQATLAKDLSAYLPAPVIIEPAIEPATPAAISLADLPF